MPGRLFITCGDLSELACDAWCIPTDGGGWITDGWVAAAQLQDQMERVGDRWILRPEHMPEGLRTLGVHCGALPHEARAADDSADEQPPPQPWLVDLGLHDAQRASEIADDEARWSATAEAFADRLEAFLRCAAEALAGDGGRPTAGYRKARALIGVPVVGIGQGGGAGLKGALIREQVKRCSALANELHVDIAIVAYGRDGDRKTFSALQRARTLLHEPPPFAADSPEAMALSELAERARNDRLVLFLGAGVGAGAGLPLWNALLARMAKMAGLADDLEELAALSPPEQAQVVEFELSSSQSTTVRDAVDAAVGGNDRVSLVHQLLASIPSDEAATTNYDTLFERACEATGQRLKVLPFERPDDKDRWLLKLHGTLGEHAQSPGSEIVLTRDDYMRYRDDRTALAGIVHALLITRHILFIGFGLDDPNFHQIIHDVRRAVGRAGQRPGSGPFATALILGDKPFSAQLWADDVQMVSFGGSADPAGEVEAFLDALVAASQPRAEFLLDETFRSLVSDAEQPVRKELLALAERAVEWPAESAAAKAVADILDSMGGRGDRNAD